MGAGRLKRFINWFKLEPIPPCVNTKCEQYGAKYCPCADMDAWSSH